MVVRVRPLHELTLPNKYEPVREVLAPPEAPAANRPPAAGRSFSTSKGAERAPAPALSPMSNSKRSGKAAVGLLQASARPPAAVTVSAHASPAMRVAIRKERPQANLLRGLPAKSPKPTSSGSGNANGGSSGINHAAGNARQYAMMSRRSSLPLQQAAPMASQGPVGYSAPQSPLQAYRQSRANSVYRSMTSSGCDVFNNRRPVYPAMARGGQQMMPAPSYAYATGATAASALRSFHRPVMGLVQVR